MAVNTAQVTSRNNAYPIVWVKLSRYCELRGEATQAVRSRIRNGIWLEDRHYRVQGRRVYVNVPEADRWVEEGL